MATANSLPKKLRARLTELGLRLRRQNIVRGCCRIVVVIVMAAAAAVLLDALIGFSRWMRGLLLLSWVGLALFEVIRFIRGPLSQHFDAEGLASAIEKEYPRLGERLTTAVELAESDDPANGSTELIDLVIADAATRTKKLDLTRAAPARTTIIFATAGAMAILAVLMPLVTVPRAGEHARRFLLPWQTTVVEASFKIVVTSGDPTVRRGESTALTALIETTKPNATLPTEVIAVIKTAKGTERLPMVFNAAKREAFLTRGPLEADFDYQIVSGEVASEWHHVAVLDPVRLDAVQVKITPPAYAAKAGDLPPRGDRFGGELFPLQYSKITYELRFSRMPTAVWLEWRPENDEAARLAPPKKLELPIAPDASATITVTALASGDYRLLMEADKLKSPPLVQTLKVAIDGPPRFDKKNGITEQPLALKPTEKLSIDCAAQDDVAVGTLQLEYRIDGVAAKPIDLKSTGLNTPRAIGSIELDLKDKVNEGQLFEYRLVAIDTRDVPEAKLTPQKTYFPAEKWAELRISSAAAPLKDQEINAKKDEIEKRLKALITALKAEQHAAYRLKVETANKPELKDEQKEKLDELIKNVVETDETLLELVKDITMSRDLAELSNAIEEVGKQEIREADASLNQARREEQAEARTRNFDKADNALVEAIRKMEALRKENDRIAKERLDRAKLDRLAEQQAKLAEATAKADKEKLEELKAKQKEIEDELKKLQADSDPIRKALDELQKKRAEQLAKEAKRLEEELRDLNRAMQENEQKARDQRMGDLLKKQAELAKKARELAEKTGDAARTAPLSPLKQDELGKAAESIEKGKYDDAIVQQERAALELQRLAQELENAIARSRDPREAAKQLERLQEDLRRRVAEATQDMPLDKLPKDRRDAFEKQQQAIQKAAQKLSVPPDAADAQKSRKDAVDRASDATDALKENDAKSADAQMQKSRDSLAKLADQLPAQEKRLAQARAEIAKLRQDQDAIARQAEQASKAIEKQDPDAAATQEDLAKRTADLAKREAQIAEKLDKIDSPGHDERRQKTAEALRQAQSDLEKGRSQDIAASQQAARRELERLEQALNGQTPADEQADRLAKKQKQLAEEMARNAQRPDEKRTRELQQQQAEMTRDVQKMSAPEAVGSKEDALELSRKTEQAASAQEAAKGAEQTAQALQKLADQINKRENEADQADRLAKKQKEAAEEADRLAKKKENPAELKKKAQQMAEEAKNLRAGPDAQKDKQEALEALQRAQQANSPEQLTRAEKDAAEALERLAEKVKQQANSRPMPQPKEQEEKLDGLPNQAQAEEARKLAEEQRKLRDDLAKAAEEMAKGDNSPPEKNPLADVVEEQNKVAKEAAELAKEVGKQKGDMTEQAKQAKQAADAANQAAEQIQNGRIDPAKEAGQQLAQKLEQLGQGDLGEERKKEAKSLAQRQEEINKKLAEMAGDARGAQAQQAERQKDLQKQVEELSQKMERLNEQMKQKANSGEPGAKTADASEKTQQANESMKQARAQNQKGRPGMSRDSQEKAADALGKAGQDLQGAAEQMMQKKDSTNQGNMPAGQAAQEARDKMAQAQNQLGQGNPKQAGEAMQQAADALKQTGQQLGKSQNPDGSPKDGKTQSGEPGGKESGANLGNPGGKTDTSPFGAFGEKFKGKSWGELPGEIKTQILQDVKARYGEDYSRYIKLYFEQLAERK